MNIKSLQPYMLYSLNIYDNEKIHSNVNNNTNTTVKENVTVEKSEKIKRNLIYTNYNKLQSKYNEQIFKKHWASDKFFWCFYRLANNYEDADLENINLLKVEKDYKIKLVETIRKNKDKFKKYKMKKNFVEDELTNNKHISLYTFQALCMLHSMNILVLKDNNTYTHFSYAENDDDTINDIDNDSNNDSNNDFKKYTIIEFNYKNTSHKGSNFEINMDNKYDDLKNMLSNYYYVENLDKPLKAYSSYKLIDLTNICAKLNILVSNNNAKPKKKQDLYEDILKKLS